MTFVKGDRVRYRSAPSDTARPNQWTRRWSGRTGIVLSRYVAGQTHVQWDDGDGDGYPNDFNLEKIEMAHTFKIGDRVRYTGDASPEFLGAVGTVHRAPDSSNVDVAWDNYSRLGLAQPVRGVFPRSLELIAPSIDTTKPLQMRGTIGGDRPVTFVTMTSEGHILTTEPGKPGWIMFDVNGNFMRSDNGAGSALRLTNKPVAKSEYTVIDKSGKHFAGYFNRQTAWDRHPTAMHMMQVDTLDGVVVGVGVLKRPS